MPLLMWLLWGDIWKGTVERSQINAANATMPLLRQVIWGNTWKRTVEKSQTNRTNATMPVLSKAILGNIWKRTVEKNQTNATNASFPALSKVIWGDIWRDTYQCRREKSVSKPSEDLLQCVLHRYSGNVTMWQCKWLNLVYNFGTWLPNFVTNQKMHIWMKHCQRHNGPRHCFYNLNYVQIWSPEGGAI